MANYATLKAAIQDVIRTNGNNEITGALLQQSLLAMINSLGVGYQYGGIATPDTNPGTPDQNVFYIASTAGTYTNFNGLVLADGEIAILKYNGDWSKDLTGAATLQQIYDLRAQLGGLSIIATESTYFPLSFLKSGNKIRIYNTSGASKTIYLRKSKNADGQLSVNVANNSHTDIILEDDYEYVYYYTATSPSPLSAKIVYFGSVYDYIHEFVDLNDNELRLRLGDLFAVNVAHATPVPFIVKAGMKLQITNNGDKTAPVYFRTDEYVSEEQLYVSIPAGKTVEIEPQYDYNYIFLYNPSYPSYVWPITIIATNSITARLDSVEEYINSNRIIIDESANLVQTDGYYRVRTGTPPAYFVAVSGWRATNPIKIQLGDIITTNTTTLEPATATPVCFDENGVIIGTLSLGNGVFRVTQELIDSGARAIGISFNLSAVPSPSVIISRIPNTSVLYEQVAELQEKISLLHNSVANAYKGNAPIPFKEKLLSASVDTTILLLGDSMTALTNNGNAVDGAANLPPGCQHDAITYQLFQLICRNKPQYDRFDSSVNPFTENGTFAISDVTKQNGTDTQYGEYSPDNCLYRETTVVNDSISFDWNLADYEKLNFIGRMGEDGTKIVRISCTPGLVQVRHNNRANPIAGYTDGQLVEANGYEFTQFLPATINKAHWLRNFPIEFVRVATTGTITLTFTNVGEDGVGTMYYWGTERWNFVTTHIVNIARAGRNTNLLWRSIGEELNYRECDLLIWQMPLWNDLKNGGDVVPTTIVAHNALLEKIANNSDSWQKFQMIVNMYHTQSFSWIKNNNIQFQANGDSTRPKTIPNDWNCCAKLLENIKSNANYSDNKITASNLYNEVIQFAIENGLTVEHLLTAGNGFTVDGVHLTTDGFAFYAGMIAAMVYD